MSTVAWDGHQLAADAQADFGGYKRPSSMPKIRTSNGIAYAVVGYMAWFDAWIKWYEDGADPASTPLHKTADETGNFLVFRDGAGFMYSAEMPYPSTLTPPDAYGSGRQFAIGALLAGCDARRAVEVAIMADPHSGGEIEVIDLEAVRANAESATAAGRKKIRSMVAAKPFARQLATSSHTRQI